ncbi:1-aminocyclopropane-1-carboxylate deaminase/D-cysteine desulfhydrase [Streptomyces sp. V2I9]|uniref:1-aminocyclopropane-1-carboxylate deaminase/D-cysteine desulfhydrase n=1 Tax=Streptomyces sp. V2I9 TaxID=3042304 RepID=UPI0027853CCD|nr:pyridoxal-phosphate dependent enzyme [Streptomyces sp. V2I9]MDQ0986933.1 1-aminocyclopropane-1-carboxylate deaminase [Streptomyces sp. V2I9]
MTCRPRLDALLRPRVPSPLREAHDQRFARHGVRLFLKRDDLIHPDLPGNKWRKLAPNLEAAAGRTVLTFGGAYSNHLRATAAAGRLLGFPTIGVVRGDELAHRPLNPSLARCAADGMRLHFVDRTTYRAKGSPEVLTGLLSLFGDAMVIPEGGSNALAAQGCTALGRELSGAVDVAAVACGTGGTLAGLAAGLDPGQRALGVPVVGGGFLAGEVARLQREAFGSPAGNWTLEEHFTFGGYARTTPELDAFAADFEDRHGLPVERVYVAKLLFALTALAGEGAFAPGTRVAAVVTGAPDGPHRGPSASR